MRNKTLLGMACTLALGISAQGMAQTATGTDYKRIDTTRDLDNWAFGVNLTTSNVNSLDDNVFSFGAFGNYFVAPNFSVGLSLDYWNDSFNTAEQRRVEIDDLVVGTNGRFTFPEVAMGLRPFALAGLALHRFQIDIANRDPNALTLVDKFNEYDRKTKDINGELGVDFGAGVLYRVQTAMDVVGEIRYRRIVDRTVDLDQMNYSVALAYTL